MISNQHMQYIFRDRMASDGEAAVITNIAALISNNSAG